MKIGCGEWGFRHLPMPDHFRLAAGFGFRTLEFGIGGEQPGRLPASPRPADIAEFRALSEGSGIATPGCCLENDFTLPDAAAHAAMLANALRQIEAAQQCGARQVRLFAGFTPAAAMTAAIWDRMLAAFDRADALCADLGLTIAIETHGRITSDGEAAVHEHTVTTEPDCLRRLLRELPPRIGFNWDPGNLKAVNPADRTCALPLLNGRINYCHLKDWRRSGPGWIACAIGDDDLDYGPLLRDLRFDGVFLIEYEPTHDPEDGIRRSLDYLRKLGIDLEFA
ncbi:MAG TPA: sugar phosphate isomerase/epimerase [Opitutus sp.]|nr:sugar phosphate isomerase/epimerase [Opitutus sp.]